MKLAVNDPDDYDLSGYMSRQPRFDLRKRNFNFEQFQTYTQIYEEARAKDEADSKHFYKLVKYVMAKQEKGETDSAVRDFMKKYKLDLIEIPKEFQDLEVEDDFQTRRPRSGRARK